MDFIDKNPKEAFILTNHFVGNAEKEVWDNPVSKALLGHCKVYQKIIFNIIDDE